MKSVPMPITIWFSQWWRKTVWCICLLSALWRDVLSSNRKGDHPQSKRTDCQWKTRWIHLPVQHEPSPSAFTLWEGEHRPLIWMIWSAFESTRSSMPTTVSCCSICRGNFHLATDATGTQPCDPDPKGGPGGLLPDGRVSDQLQTGSSWRIAFKDP